MAPCPPEVDNGVGDMGVDSNDPLLDPATWPGASGAIERVETHISRLYFTKTRVYKLKKPIQLPFLDYRSLEQRRFFSEEELRLNRRLAPEVYLRAAPLRRDAQGRVRLDGEGETIDWAVEMERLPARDMLEAVVERGEVDNELMRRIAAFLAEFHARCERGARVASFASFEVIERNALDNFVALEEHAEGRGVDVLSARMLTFLREETKRELARLRDVFARRAAEGRACDGHGDLHASNVCLTARGIVAYDCVEFAESLRCADVACDLAFLAMDLDFRGFRGFSAVLAREYAARTSDAGLLEVLDFYKTYRALVRAKVAAIRAAQSSAESLRAEAQRYVHVAASYALPPALILTCGLPASGKTWLARRLAAPFEAAHLSSDVRRKILAHVPPGQHRRDEFDAGLYSPALRERTYESLLEAARSFLAPHSAREPGGHGMARTVVVDATFPSAERRAPFRELARELGAPFVVVHARASEALTRSRMEARTHDPEETSDADWGVYLRSRESFAAPDELPASQRVAHASGEQSAEDATRAVLDRVLAQDATYRARANSPR
jgi:aminoglycoside phosphotransferase family enzyme/predicted kinase